MTLRELEIGDIFVGVKDKSRTKYVVRGTPVFNRHHGSATRFCTIQATGMKVSKSCRIEVQLQGVHEKAEQFKLNPIVS
jgi:hypothetical protein